jgi:hypothetical protein
MNFTVESELESDGRWIAEVPELPGVLAHGATREEASAKVQALALRSGRQARAWRGRGHPEHYVQNCMSDWPSTRHARCWLPSSRSADEPYGGDAERRNEQDQVSAWMGRGASAPSP